MNDPRPSRSSPGPTARLLQLAGGLVAVVVGLFGLRVVGQFLAARDFEAYGRRNLSDIYGIARQLHRGMDRSEVLALLPSSSARKILHQDGDITLLVSIDQTNWCTLNLSFERGRLIATYIIGEDGPHDVCPDAPPDILRRSSGP